jgi:hypothetical protein
MIDHETDAAVRRFLARFTSSTEGDDIETLGSCFADVFGSVPPRP